MRGMGILDCSGRGPLLWEKMFFTFKGLLICGLILGFSSKKGNKQYYIGFSFGNYLSTLGHWPTHWVNIFCTALAWFKSPNLHIGPSIGPLFYRQFNYLKLITWKNENARMSNLLRIYSFIHWSPLLHAKNQGRGSNSLAMRVQTDRHTGPIILPLLLAWEVIIDTVSITLYSDWSMWDPCLQFLVWFPSMCLMPITSYYQYQITLSKIWRHNKY